METIEKASAIFENASKNDIGVSVAKQRKRNRRLFRFGLGWMQKIRKIDKRRSDENRRTFPQGMVEDTSKCHAKFRRSRARGHVQASSRDDRDGKPSGGLRSRHENHYVCRFIGRNSHREEKRLRQTKTHKHWAAMDPRKD